jgi:hypothetical protein
MAKPRPTPPEPIPLRDNREMARPYDFDTQATGPREFARALRGSAGPAGRMEIVTPDPQESS